MKIKDILETERPRERLQSYGVQALSNSELLSIILGQGSKKENVIELSNRLLKENNLDSLSVLNISELKKVFGIGEAKACQIVSCFELGRRTASFNPEKKVSINSANDVVELFSPKLNFLKKEHFICIYLNSRKKVIKKETIFIGTLDASLVHPREIFEIAIKEGASGIILLHNHPSGDSNPSREDLEVTEQLISSGEILGISVIDHVIIGNKNYHSFRESNPEMFK